MHGLQRGESRRRHACRRMDDWSHVWTGGWSVVAITVAVVTAAGTSIRWGRHRRRDQRSVQQRA
jgi:hypothetical protein